MDIQNKKLFLIIGAPGSGKTTDAELIAQRHDNITHYSTGDMFRAEIGSGSKLGKTIDGYVSQGNLVPVDIVIDTITTAIKNAPTPIVIIDGYPRSCEQMIALDGYLKKHSEIELVNVIEVEVSYETAQDRVLGRARGADDNVEVFKNRMGVYTDPLEDIQNFYDENDKLIKISGESNIEDVVKNMDEYIQSQI